MHVEDHHLLIQFMNKQVPIYIPDSNYNLSNSATSTVGSTQLKKFNYKVDTRQCHIVRK